MYKIEKTGYGFRLTFAGAIPAEEMTKWVEESKTALAGRSGGFQLLVDMRELKPLAPDAQQTMLQGQQLYKQAGMGRSAVILSSSILTMQFVRLAKESGIYQWERYLDASKNPNWEAQALAWLEKEQDPDKK
ncbi:MAG TPA: hypothetical protein PKH07_12490 [bacterium]|nr:hypothetical protein [bacterium]